MPLCVVILGAGAGGACAAVHLAQDGHDVTVIEARAFPRRKVCGEFLAPAGLLALRGALGDDAPESLGARRIDAMELWALGERARVALREPAWALSRESLDAALLDRARACGARVVQPATATGVDVDDAGVRVRLASGEVIRADVVLHADGWGRHDGLGPTPARRGLVGHKCRVRFAPGIDAPGAEVIRMHACAGAYVGLVAVEPHASESGNAAPTFTCALVATSERTRAHAGDQDALLRGLLGEDCGVVRVSEWLSCPVARGMPRVGAHPRSLRVGNAAGAVDPVGGEGIGLALWAGREAARTLRDAGTSRGGLGGLGGLAEAQERYARAYRERLRVRLPACGFAAACLMRPELVRAVLSCGYGPAALRAFARLTGKDDSRVPG